MTGLAVTVVVLTSLWLMTQGIAALIARPRVERFLEAFARSAKAHYLEQVLRLIAGAGLVLAAGTMQFTMLFRVFGWIVIVTSCGLLLIPWTWHRAFARWAVPWALRHLGLYALGSIALGGLMLYAVVAP